MTCAAKARAAQGYLVWGRANPQAEFPIRQIVPEEATDDRTHFVFPQSPHTRSKSKSETWYMS